MKKYLPKIIGTSINLVSNVSTKTAVKIAFTLFSTPQKGKMKTTGKSIVDSAEQKTLAYGNLPIMTYHWYGKKETVLLVHGWESNTIRWKKMIEILNELDYNVVALDGPAHGKSGGKLFNAVLYSEFINIVSQEFNPSIIIGHSVGGMATIISHHKHHLPNTEKLVLLGAPSNFEGIFNRYKRMMRYNKKVADGIDNYTLENFNNLPSYYHIANFSENIKPKGLIIHDKEDKIIPYSDALDYQKYYKNAELITTTGLGHGLKDKKVNEHILDFINQ
ncbi:alpha/beta hydrolase [Flavobacteriaceae bacterium XHP0103]|uniref:alpha/beta hydrolase n=1 Tax=Marixanthotalea marina TaxID=2844359 RepID=UPI002989ECA4|nr:alpha/beta hydrolase [Marixanthotalea marina]MBU3822682.1 alpha/beta hydrolase [Marixanthotalea marina]